MNSKYKCKMWMYLSKKKYVQVKTHHPPNCGRLRLQYQTSTDSALSIWRPSTDFHSYRRQVEWLKFKGGKIISAPACGGSTAGTGPFWAQEWAGLPLPAQPPWLLNSSYATVVKIAVLAPTFSPESRVIPDTGFPICGPGSLPRCCSKGVGLSQEALLYYDC